MTFQSLNFIVFFVCSVIAIFILPKKIQNTALVIVNMLFAFLVGSFQTVVFLLIATFSTFFGAIGIEKNESKAKKRLVLISVLLLNIAFLFVLKYSAFFVTTANGFCNIFHIGKHFDLFKIIAPAGISFYTIWMIGYLLDVYWESYKAERNFINYAVFATYFPLITSGPIVRYSTMREQLSVPRYLKTENVSKGLLRVCWGYFEKMVIADNIAKIVNQIFDNYAQYTGFFIFLGVSCFAIQLYTDFCGCIDIAIGCSKILGIELPENFDAPFFSKSISEYWRRWHITLGTWFKDYFMYPILKSEIFVQLGKKIKEKYGKKAAKKIPAYIAMSFLWFTIGFWHGGLWKYIIGSGLLHCFYMTFSDALDDVFKKIKNFLHINDTSWWWKGFQMIRTFLLVCSGFIFFRSGGIRHAIGMYKNLFKPSMLSYNNLHTVFIDSNISILKVVVLVFSVGLLFLTSITKKCFPALATKIYGNKVFSFIISLGLIGFVFLFAATGQTSFIYFQF